MSLPVSVWDDVVTVAARLGVTRSALVAETMQESLKTMVALLDITPRNPTPDDVRRLRGASIDLVKQRVSETINLLKGGSHE